MKRKVLPIDLREKIAQELAEDHECYILITCDPPTPDGNMQVNMRHKGDSFMVSYLINGAQSIIDKEIEDEIDYDEPIPVVE